MVALNVVWFVVKVPFLVLALEVRWAAVSSSPTMVGRRSTESLSSACWVARLLNFARVVFEFRALL
jgi:hypothetical protein